MRQRIAAGNWKMNLSLDEGLQLSRKITNDYKENGVLVILAAPFVYLKTLADLVFPVNSIQIAAQNCHQELSGAYTGEVSIPMLQSINVNYVIIGHSERREYFNETDALLKKKLDALIANDMTPIFCCGEPLEVRESGRQNTYVEQQLKNSIMHLSGEDISKLIIAYEPIWAIGTGKTASSDQAQEMHAFIRRCIEEKYGIHIAQSIPILYGGSVKPANAKELFSMKDVDGGLVGGASLDADGFLDIINAFE